MVGFAQKTSLLIPSKVMKASILTKSFTGHFISWHFHLSTFFLVERHTSSLLELQSAQDVARYLQQCGELHSCHKQSWLRRHEQQQQPYWKWQRRLTWKLTGISFQYSSFCSHHQCLAVFKAEHSTFWDKQKRDGGRCHLRVDKLASKRQKTQFPDWWHSGKKVTPNCCLQVTLKS